MGLIPHQTPPILLGGPTFRANYRLSDLDTPPRQCHQTLNSTADHQCLNKLPKRHLEVKQGNQMLIFMVDLFLQKKLLSERLRPSTALRDIRTRILDLQPLKYVFDYSIDVFFHLYLLFCHARAQPDPLTLHECVGLHSTLDISVCNGAFIDSFSFPGLQLRLLQMEINITTKRVSTMKNTTRNMTKRSMTRSTMKNMKRKKQRKKLMNLPSWSTHTLMNPTMTNLQDSIHPKRLDRMAQSVGREANGSDTCPSQ
jgi:hypothetical protein